MKLNEFNEILEIESGDEFSLDPCLTISEHGYEFNRYLQNQDGTISENIIKILPIINNNSEIVDKYITSQFNIDREFVNSEKQIENGIAKDIIFDFLTNLELFIYDASGHAKYCKFKINQDGTIRSNNTIRVLPVTDLGSNIIKTHYVIDQYFIENNFINGQYITPAKTIAHDIDFNFRGQEKDYENDTHNYEIINGVVTKRDTTIDINNKRISDIKKKANEVIISRLPEWKQRNYIARMTELLLVMQTQTTLTQAEQDELIVLQNEWNWVKNVRQISNTAESDGTLLKDINWTLA